MTGKLCVLGAIFMMGLVFLWLCHVCCRAIWRAILLRLGSSSRFSRILELSEINRERLGVLPPAAGAPVTHLAFLTTYVSTSTRPMTVATHFSRYNRDRLRSRPSQQNGVVSSIANGTVIPTPHEPSGRVANGVCRSGNAAPHPRSSALPSHPASDYGGRDRTQTFIRQDTQSTCGGMAETGFMPPPTFLSIDSVGSDPTLDIHQSTTLTIASANSPPPSYHSTESIMSQPASLYSHRDRVIRDFPRQTSDSSETSTQSAPSHTVATAAQPSLSRRERLQQIAETNITSSASSSSGAIGSHVPPPVPLPHPNSESPPTETNAVAHEGGRTLVTDSAVTEPPPLPDDMPPSYEELFGSDVT